MKKNSARVEQNSGVHRYLATMGVTAVAVISSYQNFLQNLLWLKTRC
jgi:hypothetical protein